MIRIVKKIISFLCANKNVGMYKILFFLIAIPFFSSAQDKKILVEGVSPNLYVNHKVLAKENFYSIGRIYNISPREIAPFNNLQLEKGLSPGQNLKIPIHSSFFQEGTADTDETFIPVYYITKDKEGLSKVSQNHNNISIEALKKWNNLKNETLKKGTSLIVGYLKVKNDLSPLAKNGIGNTIKAEEAAKVISNVPSATTTPVIVAETTHKPAQTSTAVKVEKNNEGKPSVESEEVAVDKKIKQSKKLKGGVFKTLYESQVNDIKEEVQAGVFKSTSGWTDYKFYCLHNTAPQGTIIKITNPATDKYVFAKVLDLIPDIKQNNSLSVIISSAAAAELGVTDSNFSCVLNYSK